MIITLFEIVWKQYRQHYSDFTSTSLPLKKFTYLAQVLSYGISARRRNWTNFWKWFFWTPMDIEVAWHIAIFTETKYDWSFKISFSLGNTEKCPKWNDETIYIYNHGWNLQNMDEKCLFIEQLAIPSQIFHTNQRFHPLRNIIYSLKKISSERSVARNKIKNTLNWTGTETARKMLQGLEIPLSNARTTVSSCFVRVRYADLHKE